jgi:methylated-DNA-[protein]-cysteine S-methyltransferase
MLYFSSLDTPLGTLTLLANGDALTGAQFARPPDDATEDNALTVFVLAKQQLLEYQAGTRRHFSLPIAPEGTAFQRSVWDELQRIPYGQTMSYGTLAERLGNPKASRAVGAANGKNPLWLIVPCHRVIGANGSLTGYAGGLSRKQALLQFESGVLAAQARGKATMPELALSELTLLLS